MVRRKPATGWRRLACVTFDGDYQPAAIRLGGPDERRDLEISHDALCDLAGRILELDEGPPALQRVDPTHWQRLGMTSRPRRRC
jgi:hypothetical protein